MVRTDSSGPREDGQIVPVLMVAFVAILAVGLVLFQVGSATSIRAQAQTAADSAALAGAKSIGQVLEQRLTAFSGPMGTFDLAADLASIPSGEAAARSYAERNGATLPPGGFFIVPTPTFDPTTGVILLAVQASVVSKDSVPGPNGSPTTTPGSAQSGRDAGSGEHANATARAELRISLGANSSSGPALGVGLGGGGPSGSGPNAPGDMPHASVNGFAFGQCTDYVAWRLAVAGINVDYTRFPGQWNANQWATNAQALGYTVDHNPAPGAIAVWTGGQFGHVAVVAAVNAGSLTVQDYNWAWDQAYHVHTVSGADWYVHFGDALVAALKPAGTAPTPPAGSPGPLDFVFHFNGQTRLIPVSTSAA